MKKRLLKTAVATALTLAFAAPAFAAANPFSDVPAKHWAYDAVNKLAQAGIVDGYGDGTFRGDKTMTRYEMATIIAKAMNKNLNNDQKQVVDKLSKEFGTELNTLGVKVAGLQNQMDNMVKFSGDARARYYSADNVTTGDRMEYRFRLGATAKVNDDTSLYARITSGSQSIDKDNAGATLENAFVSTKALGLNAKIGRQDYDLGQGALAGAGSTAILNGVKIDSGNFTVFGGKEEASKGVLKDAYGAQYSFKLGAPIAVDYLNLNDVEYYAASTKFDLMPGLNIAGEFVKNQTQGTNAMIVKAGLGKTGLSVAYKDIEANAVPYEGNNNLKANTTQMTELSDFYALSAAGNHVKGMEYEYNNNFAKNMNLNVLYQDIQDHGQNVRATVNVKF